MRSLFALLLASALLGQAARAETVTGADLMKDLESALDADVSVHGIGYGKQGAGKGRDCDITLPKSKSAKAMTLLVKEGLGFPNGGYKHWVMIDANDVVQKSGSLYSFEGRLKQPGRNERFQRSPMRITVKHYVSGKTKLKVDYTILPYPGGSTWWSGCWQD